MQGRQDNDIGEPPRKLAFKEADYSGWGCSHEEDNANPTAQPQGTEGGAERGDFYDLNKGSADTEGLLVVQEACPFQCFKPFGRLPPCA